MGDEIEDMELAGFVYASGSGLDFTLGVMGSH